jgi:hypothetical protein
MKWSKLLFPLTIVTVLLSGVLVAQEMPDVEGSATNLLVYLCTIGTSAALGVIKKYTALLDTALGKVIKPIQPVIVAGLGLVLPWLATQLGLAEVPAADIVASAPVATVATISFREILKAVRKALAPPA